MALGLGFDLAFWFGLDQVVGDDPLRGALTAAYLFTRLLSIARRLFIVLAPLPMKRDVAPQGWFTILGLAVTIVANGLVIYMLYRASLHGAAGRGGWRLPGRGAGGRGREERSAVGRACGWAGGGLL